MESKANGILACFSISELLERSAMMLSCSTWYEISEYLEQFDGVIIPAGSTEQHGPIGLIGTDAICAETISERAAERAHALVAPCLAFSPAPFNALFPGTISVTESLFARLAREVVSALMVQGFRKFYFLNGHGANIAPLNSLKTEIADASVRVQSWWDFPQVSELRSRHFGDWEGMHATPSEISITQFTTRFVESPLALEPPEKLSPEFLRKHAGDRHGPAEEHMRRFPDGRVGSHSALASSERGKELFEAAVAAVSEDYLTFVKASGES
ncbi:MAG: creatininase family protein [Albidovulum sp.]|nr:creatininase family protein [Albidovulum sp.]